MKKLLLISFTLAFSSCSSSKYKVKNVDTKMDVKGTIQGSKIGLDEQKQAIIQTETTTEVELQKQQWANYDLEKQLSNSHEQLTRCRTDLADPRLGGSGQVVEIPEIDNMKKPANIKEEIGLDEQGNLKVVKKEYYLNDEGNQIDILGKSVELRIKEINGESISFPDNYYQGDYIYDIEAGKQAGAVTALLRHPDVNISFCTEGDFVISRLLDIIEIVRLGLPMLPGKMPGEFLAPFLEGLDYLHDPDIIIPPGIGEDTVAVKAGGEKVLVMKSDPITFITNDIGYYTVLINANDIATAGAKPRWMLNTLLFPVGTTPSSALFIMNELKMVCRKWGISLCGGHTEITSAVNRPIAIGMLVGTVEYDKLIDKRRMQEGDQILITKKVAVEGTAIIAGELSDRLRKLGLSQAQIASGIKLKEEIGIVKEAMIAAEHGGISAMHAVTEGGLATAITELSIAGNQKLRIHMEKIPFYPMTEIFCKKLHLDPLGLIGSGMLLICCRKEVCPELIEKVKSAGIDITCIGEVGQPGVGVEAFKKGEKTTWPSFQADEITRVL